MTRDKRTTCIRKKNKMQKIATLIGQMSNDFFRSTKFYSKKTKCIGHRLVTLVLFFRASLMGIAPPAMTSI